MTPSHESINSNIILIATISILFLIIIMVLFYVFFIKKKTKLLIQRQIREKKFENELASTQVEIKEETLNYIGQELHDDIGQKLTVARMRNNQLIPKLKGKEQEELKEINLILKECIQDIRDLSKTLIGKQIEHFGLVDSLEREVNKLKKLAYLEIEFHYNNHDIDINNKHALILFRITQECINNALRHSKTEYLKLEINDTPSTLSLIIKDKGKGFDTNNIYSGSGMKNISSRAKLINTRIDISSKINLGTSVLIKYNKNEKN